jgi:hypothetical protein
MKRMGFAMAMFCECVCWSAWSGNVRSAHGFEAQQVTSCDTKARRVCCREEEEVVVKQMEWNIRLLSHPSSGQILDIGPESAWLAQLEDADPLKACLTNNIHLSQTSPSRYLQSATNAADLARRENFVPTIATSKSQRVVPTTFQVRAARGVDDSSCPAPAVNEGHASSCKKHMDP